MDALDESRCIPAQAGRTDAPGELADDGGVDDDDAGSDGDEAAVRAKRKAAGPRGPPNLTKGLPDQSNVQNRKHVIEKLSSALESLNDKGDGELRAAELELVGINTKKVTAEVETAVSVISSFSLA